MNQGRTARQTRLKTVLKIWAPLFVVPPVYAPDGNG